MYICIYIYIYITTPRTEARYTVGADARPCRRCDGGGLPRSVPQSSWDAKGSVRAFFPEVERYPLREFLGNPKVPLKGSSKGVWGGYEAG